MMDFSVSRLCKQFSPPRVRQRTNVRIGWWEKLCELPQRYHGKDHPAVADSLNYWAALYREQVNTQRLNPFATGARDPKPRSLQNFEADREPFVAQLKRRSLQKARAITRTVRWIFYKHFYLGEWEVFVESLPKNLKQSGHYPRKFLLDGSEA
jgi:hypothetical protein